MYTINCCKQQYRRRLSKRLQALGPELRRALAAVTAVLALTALLSTCPDSARADGFVTFESGQVRPLALSPNGTRLYAVNTPDNRLEIFDVTASGLRHVGSVAVGLEPVAVAAHNDGEVWVVNHLSDSVSVVDVGTPDMPARVIRTLLVGDEPRDIVFAGSGEVDRAFITCAHRGQNSFVALADLTKPGIGRADVWVFDANDLGSIDGGTPVPGTPVVLFGDTPRALAVSPDRSVVYAAIFNSGNRTTTVSEGAVCDTDDAHFADNTVQGPCTVEGVTMPGGMPLPHTDASGEPRPETGLIVKFNGTHWVDRTCAAGVNYGHVCSQDSDCPGSTCGRIWDNAVRFNLPDKDVFAIDANGDPPKELIAWTGVGTILFNMVANPVTGKVYVTNGDAQNQTRFEGPGIFGGSTVQGHLLEMRISVLDARSRQARHLNKHIDYSLRPAPDRVKENSLSTPLGMAISGDGTTLYVAAFGSSAVGVFDTAQLEADTFTPSSAGQIPVSGGGPSGVVLDEAHQRLYALTRFDNGIAVINTATRTEIDHRSLYNPEPKSVVDGRPFLYDARRTSSNGEASCASCHIFGNMDQLAWDLGNPDGAVVESRNPLREDGLEDFAQGLKEFHPMKGPMTTQTLRGMAGHGPMHWRGDRTGGANPGGNPLDATAAFMAFNVAFEGLIGRQSQLTDAEMQAFADFVLQITPPPNPNRALDNSLTAAQQSGKNLFFGPRPLDGDLTCKGCHALDPDKQHFGTDGFTVVDPFFDLQYHTMKVPQLRNLYEKIGMFGMPGVSFFTPGDNQDMGAQIRGFGFLHDGSVDTVFRFVNLGGADPERPAFDFEGGDEPRRQVEQYVLAFDSNLAPIVGQQVTLPNPLAALACGFGRCLDFDAALDRLDLLTARARAGECDLTAKGTICAPTGVDSGSVSCQQRGWYLQRETGLFVSDRRSEPTLTDEELRTLPGRIELTYTCVPPGSGERIGIDRDGDGYFDGDEIDAGSDPANPSSPTAASCSGDCDSSGEVTVDEVLKIVNITLGRMDPLVCAHNMPRDSAVDITFCVKAVASALGSCR